MVLRCCAATASSALALFASNVALAASPDQVDSAIQRGVAALYATQRNGHWEISPGREVDGAGWSQTGGQWGGRTALVTYALLASGESPNDPRLKKAIDFLRGADVIGNYALGMRAQMYTFLPQNDENRRAASRDFGLLMEGVRKDTRSRARGTYDYVANQTERVDLSVSQYGVLGMWAISQAGGPAAEQALAQRGYWKMVEDAWLRLQDPQTGGWAYEGPPSDGHPITASMTAAGVATLFITQDYLHADEGVACAGNVSNARIDAGIKYLAAEFPKLVGDAPMLSRMYTLYGIERIGVASGLKYLDGVDWFEKGSDFLVRTQGGNGAWTIDYGPEISTSFALLFLSRGREPVMMSKLKYDITGGARGDKVLEGTWNQRPRDVANATRWVGKQVERTLNWQVVDLDRSSVRDLHDAPMLYLAGGQSLQFTKPQRDKLRAYVESGGMLVFNPDCSKKAYLDAVRSMLVARTGGGAAGRQAAEPLFEGYEWKPLLKESAHRLTDNQMFVLRGKRLPKMSILSNGVRVLAVLFEEDVGRAWQLRDERRADPWQVMANLYQYAVDKTNMNFKGRTYYVEADPKIPTTRAIKVARLKHAAGWDPEPGGWRRLAALFRNARRIDLVVTPVELGSGDLAGYKVAHLTGTDQFALSAEAVDQLKAFIAAGGTLVVDAAGGDGTFKTSVEAELLKLVPAAPEWEKPLPANHAVFTGGGLPVPTVRYRTFAQQKLVGSLSEPRLRGISVNGRLAIVYSGEDLTAGLVGNAVDGVVGYTPDTATELMTRIVFFATGTKAN